MEEAEQIEGHEEQATGIRHQAPGDGGRGEGADSEPRTQNSEPLPDTRHPTPDPQVTPDPQAELEEVRRRWVESHRRALLAENAGRVVPELVAGSTVEELDRSLEVARSAFEAARATALVEISAPRVPAGNPVRQGPNLEAMSPMEKIAYGLRRE